MATSTVEHVGPCKKLLRVVVPAADVQAKLDEQYETLRENASVPGFRKGRAPRVLLEKRFGEQVVDEVKETLMSEACEAALEENGLVRIGEPSYDQVEFAADSDFTFEITVEVEPEFEVPEYKGLKLVRPKAEIGDENVDKALERIRAECGAFEPVEDGEVQEGDGLQVEWSLQCEGELAASEDNATISAEATNVGGVETKGLPEALAGAKPGDTREAPALFPEDHPNEAYRNKEGRIQVRINRIYRRRLPELDDAFAKTLDFDSLEELKKEVRVRLQRTAEREVQERVEDEAINQLLDAVQIELPESMVKMLSREILLRQQLRMRYDGVAEPDIQERLKSLQGMSEDLASRQYRVMFLLRKIADKEKIFVTEDEVAARLESLAAQSDMSVSQVVKEMEERGGGLSSLRAQMRDEKVIQMILTHAEIQDET